MEIQTPELLKILSNKTNLEIINLLKNEPSYPRKISEILGMQEGYISRILTQLEKLGILRSQWVYRERNVKLYSVDTQEISISFEPEGLRIAVKTRGGREISVSYDAFTFEIPEIQGFVGRENELQLFELSPIVVIEGIAGVGKTYLAAKYMQEAQEEGKRIFWHTFTEIDSLHYVINKVSVFLNNIGYSNLLEYVKQNGKDDRVLLSLFQRGISEDMVFCFDGFQQVRDDKIVALFRLLKNLRGKIIITSRERPPFLSISRRDITEIRLSSLSERETLDFLRSRGITLHDGFVRKAHLRLGGHPLTLDMFCDAVRERKAADILESLPVFRVEDYLWSEIFEKLSDRDRRFVEHLSLFRVPAPVEMLRKICSLRGFWTVLKGLEKRMLIGRQNGGYVLPSMIKKFTYQTISNKKELHRKVAACYLETRNAEGLLEAMYHFLQAGEQEKAGRIITEPQDVDLIEQGYLSPYLEILSQVSKEEVSPEVWCSVTCAKGKIFILYGDTKKAAAEFEEMQKTAQEIDSEKDYAKALHQLGTIHAFHGEWQKAHDYFNQSLHILEESKDHRDIVGIHADIGLLLMKQHQFKEALSHFERGKGIAETVGYKSGCCKMLRRIANIYYYQDEFDTALQYYQESLTMAEETLDVIEVSANYNDMGLVHFYREEFEEALECFEKDREISERISDIKANISSYGNLGMVYADIEENEKAETYYEQALHLARELEDPYYTTYLEMKMAYLSLQKGEIKRAKEFCDLCLECEQLKESLHYGEFCRVFGMVLYELGDWEKSRILFEKSIEKLSDSPLELGKTYLEYAVGMQREGNENAQEYYDRALELFGKVSAQREIKKAEKKWKSST
jgi:tetratricopeptide (TPR) repeat protein/DNA-binding transcriptional ArsR family regulator